MNNNNESIEYYYSTVTDFELILLGYINLLISLIYFRRSKVNFHDEIGRITRKKNDTIAYPEKIDLDIFAIIQDRKDFESCSFYYYVGK